MKRIKTGKIKLKDIKHIENSRLRGQDDVGDLMHDIEQRGLLENIGIRLEDNALIFGNRRVKAYEKLDYTEIEADFYEDLTDEDLLITNLAENIKRKKIGSIEIGRIIKILQGKGLTNTEVSMKLGITLSRTQSAVSAYNITVNTPFEKLVVHGKMGREHKGIPESLIWQVQNSLSRARRLTKNDWNQLLRVLETGELTSEKIGQLRKILLSSPQLPIVEALDVLGRCRVVHVWYHFNNNELCKAMRKEKCVTESEFIRLIMRKYNSDILF